MELGAVAVAALAVLFAGARFAMYRSAASRGRAYAESAGRYTKKRLAFAVLFFSTWLAGGIWIVASFDMSERTRGGIPMPLAGWVLVITGLTLMLKAVRTYQRDRE
jgi:hypothetical protein